MKIAKKPLSPAWPWIGAAALGLLAFALGCRLSLLSAPEREQRGSSIVSVLFGASRGALSADLYQEADTFFHKGVAYSRPPSHAGDPFRKLLNQVSPEYHEHVTGKEVGEVMPWLRLATLMDPHNIDAYLVAAFWMVMGAQRIDLAEQILREARRNNAGNYRVLLEQGRFELRLNRRDLARQALDAAIRNWPGTDDPRDEQVRLDRAEMLTYRALLYEVASEPQRAAQLLAEVLQLFPERIYLQQRIADLRAGRPALVPAGSMMKALLNRVPAHMTDAHGDAPHDDEDAHHDDAGHAGDK